MEIKNLAILNGENTTVDKGIIKISVPKLKNESPDDNEKKIKSSEIRSDVFFSNGTIEFKFKASSHETGIMLIFRTSGEDGVAIGLSRTHKCFLISRGITRFNLIASAGTFTNYSLNEEHTMKIEINGSIAKLYINNILMCTDVVNIKETVIEFRVTTEGNLEVRDIKVHAIKPKIFVVMQFTKEYNELFEDVIKPITEKAGFECIRADEFYTSTPILKDIIESIQDSTAIIAEITPDNPNVFYEIGYSHAINKPTILLCDTKREKLPFDVSSFRTLFYENTIAGKKKVEESLTKYLENIK